MVPWTLDQHVGADGLTVVGGSNGQACAYARAHTILHTHTHIHTQKHTKRFDSILLGMAASH